MLWSSWEYSDYRVLEFGTGYYSVRHCLGRMAGFFPTPMGAALFLVDPDGGFSLLEVFRYAQPMAHI